MRLSRAIWLAGVSAAAIIAVRPVGSLAADLPVKAPMHTAVPAPFLPWTLWVEGGLQGVAGSDPSIAGLTPPFAPAKKAWGWGGAGAIDYRFDSVWHASAAFRYGENKTRTSTSVQQGVSTTGFIFVGGNSASRKESNWAADFMVGRDFGLGTGNAQLKAGMRVAKIRGTTDGSGLLISATSAFKLAQKYGQTSKFTGAGPRVAIEGSQPLGGPWSLDYMAGVAGLFGNHSLDQTGSSPQLTPGGVFFQNNCLVGCPANISSSSSAPVFNADAMLGIAYAITTNAELLVNYRVDYYADAMRTVNRADGFTDTYRLYHGPNLRLTLNF
jgi:hypothetical protein